MTCDPFHPLIDCPDCLHCKAHADHSGGDEIPGHPVQNALVRAEHVFLQGESHV